MESNGYRKPLEWNQILTDSEGKGGGGGEGGGERISHFLLRHHIDRQGGRNHFPRYGVCPCAALVSLCFCVHSQRIAFSNRRFWMGLVNILSPCPIFRYSIL